MNPITLHDERGRRMFSFDLATDPYKVVLAVAWAYANKVPLCNWGCPASDGSYCLDCHAFGYSALMRARQLFGQQGLQPLDMCPMCGRFNVNCHCAIWVDMPCTHCEGVGTYKCPDCDKGIIELPAEPGMIPMTTWCRHCLNGRIKCTACDGQGSIDTIVRRWTR